MAGVDGLSFTGRLAVPADPTSASVLAKYAQRYYPYYLARILGATLAEIVTNDITSGAEPNDPDLLKLYRAFQYDEGGCIVDSPGIALIISGFVYWEYMKDSKVKPSMSTGTAQVKPEIRVSGVVPETQVFERYNEAVIGARAIRSYALKNADLYPTFNGQEFLLNYPQ